MNFYRTFYDLTTLLPEAERRKVNTALLDYFFEGIEPKGLSESGMKVFKGCEGRISKSRTNAANVANRYSDSKPTNEPTEDATNDAAEGSTKPLPDRERDREVDKEGAKEKRKAARFRAPSRRGVRVCPAIRRNEEPRPPRHRLRSRVLLRLLRVKRMACRQTADEGLKATVRRWLRTSKPKNGIAKEVPDDGFSAYD